MFSSRGATGSSTRSSRVPTRPRRDFSAMEVRRRQAVRMFKHGSTQAEVARALGVSRQSAGRWYKKWRAEGAKAAKGAGRAGRLPRLSDGDLAKVDRALRKGPVANGYPTDLWTLQRVAEVIERTTGVRYHPGHVWRIMKVLGWSLQRPARRAVERDEDKVQGWIQDRWPTARKTPGGAGPG